MAGLRVAAVAVAASVALMTGGQASAAVTVDMSGTIDSAAQINGIDGAALAAARGPTTNPFAWSAHLVFEDVSAGDFAVLSGSVTIDGVTYDTATYPNFGGEARVGGGDTIFTFLVTSDFVPAVAGEERIAFGVYFTNPADIPSSNPADYSAATMKTPFFEVLGECASACNPAVVGQARWQDVGEFTSFSIDGAFSRPGPVPEPATWALMIGGFGLAGSALRRRRSLTSVV